MTTLVKIDDKDVSLWSLKKMSFYEIWDVTPDYFKSLSKEMSVGNEEVINNLIDSLMKNDLSVFKQYGELLLQYFTRVIFDEEFKCVGSHSTNFIKEFNAIIANKKKNKEYEPHSSTAQYLMGMYPFFDSVKIVNELKNSGESVEDISSKMLFISLFTGLSNKMEDMGFCNKCGQHHGLGCVGISSGNLVFTMGYPKPCMTEELVNHEIDITDGVLLCTDWFIEPSNELADKSNVWEDRAEGGRWGRISLSSALSQMNEYEKEGVFSHVSYGHNQLFTNGERFVVLSDFSEEVKVPAGWKCLGEFYCNLRRVLITSKKTLANHVSKNAMTEIMKNKENNMLKLKVPSGKYQFTSDVSGFSLFTKKNVPDWLPEEFASSLVTYFQKV